MNVMRASRSGRVLVRMGGRSIGIRLRAFRIRAIATHQHTASTAQTAE